MLFFNESNFCKICIDGFYRNELGECSSCSLEFDNCSKCISSYENNELKCTECIDGYSLNFEAKNIKS